MTLTTKGQIVGGKQGSSEACRIEPVHHNLDAREINPLGITGYQRVGMPTCGFNPHPGRYPFEEIVHAPLTVSCDAGLESFCCARHWNELKRPPIFYFGAFVHRSDACHSGIICTPSETLLDQDRPFLGRASFKEVSIKNHRCRES